MRSRFVVFFAPRGQVGLGFGKAAKPVLVQTLIPEAPVETLDARVLDRPSRGNEVEPSPSALRPGVEAQRTTSWGTSGRTLGSSCLTLVGARTVLGEAEGWCAHLTSQPVRWTRTVEGGV